MLDSDSAYYRRRVNVTPDPSKVAEATENSIKPHQAKKTVAKGARRGGKKSVTASPTTSTAEDTENKKKKYPVLLPFRPAYGTEGKEITLWANYVELNLPEDLKLPEDRDNADSQPPAYYSPTGVKHARIINQFLEEYDVKRKGQQQERRDTGCIASDFEALLISTMDFENDLDHSVTYKAETGLEESGSNVYVVELKSTGNNTNPGALEVQKLYEYMKQVTIGEPLDINLAEFTQAFNILLRHYSKSRAIKHGDQVVSGSKAYDVRQRSKLDDFSFSLLYPARAYFSSVCLASARILVNVNLPEKIVDKHAAEYNDHKQRINGNDYVVNVGSDKKPQYYPVGVCIVQPGQTCRIKLSPSETEKMIRCAVMQPMKAISAITKEGFGVIGLGRHSPFGPNPRLDVLQPLTDVDLITVRGRQLNLPGIGYKNNLKGEVTSRRWNLASPKDSGNRKDSGNQKLQYFSPRAIPTMGLLIIKPLADKTTRAAIIEGAETLRQTLKDRGITGMRALTDSQRQCKFIVVVLPNPDKSMYDTIKNVDVKLGIRTACVVAENMMKTGDNMKRYCENVALKINLKMEGACHKLASGSFPPKIKLEETMIIGLDITHPSFGSADTASSIVGMVANVEETFTSWPVAFSLQETATNEFPENIIIYRDGVSEGQYEQVIDFELSHIREACKQIQLATPGLATPPPNITIVIVRKQHHTRFYLTKGSAPPENAQPELQNGNPVAGTVVERGVTSQFTWEFFLQAHHLIQGVARPAHYVVVHDEVFRSQGGFGGPNEGKIAVDNLEKFTHALSYVFNRSTTAIGVCVPARLADLACDRARRYLAAVYDGSSEDEVKLEQIAPHEVIKDVMYYI
ncbi:ribonuclease H-like domain-containing protein [Podospora didyma]|uniref:Ribonuclease H-like domain-containing protein n=1 Tax=Podospora didyma TaxID=330526 RepID=A0AAE0K0S7_9PEZI|nr:ribonuclease H-like domain-containing protein [Podospora didyma]